ncbi:hypothetical protein D043_0727B, partial [Vibrio parahaemolyticus EKP-021]
IGQMEERHRSHTLAVLRWV